MLLLFRSLDCVENILTPFLLSPAAMLHALDMYIGKSRETKEMEHEKGRGLIFFSVTG